MDKYYEDKNSFTKNVNNDTIKVDKLGTIVSNAIANIRKNKEDALKIIGDTLTKKYAEKNKTLTGDFQKENQKQSVPNNSTIYKPSSENKMVTSLPYKPADEGSKPTTPSFKIQGSGKTESIYNPSSDSNIKNIEKSVDNTKDNYYKGNVNFDFADNKSLNMVGMSDSTLVEYNNLSNENAGKQNDIKIAATYDNKYKDLTINRWLEEGKNKTKEDVINEIKGSFIYDITTLAQSTNDILKEYAPGLHTASKDMQRDIWKKGADIILEQKKCYTSAWMLKHSLEENPEKVVRGDDSRIANLMKNDKEYLTKLDEVLKTKKDGVIDEDLKGVIFSEEDLYFSINKAEVHVTGKREADGTWNLTTIVTDTYDFTEILFPEIGMSLEKLIGTFANDGAYISQILEAITPYEVEVTFNLRRKPE